MLPRRTLGRTGIPVSVLGLGTVKFGRNTAVKYPRAFDLPSDAEIDRLLDRAQDLGVNLLDTAPAYGTSEERLGRALARFRRQDWVIVTKAGEEFEDGASRFDFSAPALRASLERSCRRLGVPELDVVLLHSDGRDEAILSDPCVVEELDSSVRRGIVRAWGISSKTVPGGLLGVRTCPVVMVTYNPDQTEERPVLDAAREGSVGVLVKKGLSSGHLGRSGPIDLAGRFRFLLSPPAVSSVVVGTLSLEHLEANIRAAGEACGK